MSCSSFLILLTVASDATLAWNGSSVIGMTLGRSDGSVILIWYLLKSIGMSVMYMSPGQCVNAKGGSTSKKKQCETVFNALVTYYTYTPAY